MSSANPTSNARINPFVAQGQPALSVDDSLKILTQVGHAANGNFADHLRIQQALWVITDRLTPAAPAPVAADAAPSS